MASWVEDDARSEAKIYRDGPEVWRNLKVSLRQAIEDYTRIYSPAGTMEIQFTECTETTDNCIRVRTVPSSTMTDICPMRSFFQ